MAWPRTLSRLLYPPRRPDPGGEPSIPEIEAWVEAAGTEHFQQRDEAFVERARGLGVTSGMVLDLNSRLGLVALKILWNEEDLLSIGVYRSLDVAERVRQTAEDWGLGERMFFQVGEPTDLRFKTGYFDLVVSDGTLQTSENPVALLEEIGRVAKPGGAILLGQQRRRSRLLMGRALSEETKAYPQTLRARARAELESGYTASELEALVAQSGLRGARVVPNGPRLFIERPGRNDPSSWVSEREKYR